MRINTLILSALISGSMVGSTAALAAAPSGADYGHGTLHFTGSVINSPCSIAPGDEDIDVPLGQIANKVLEAGAGYSSTQPITIHLQNCDLQAHQGVTSGSGTVDYPDFSKVVVKFAGSPDAKNADLYANTGTAQGVGIRLMDTMAGNTPLAANAPSADHGLTTGDNILKFGARLEKNGDAVTTGTVAADVTYAMEYK
ncbi:fimbrial protein [Salmonella enterica subsp. enterica serovar Adelaide]|uniref:fimbrial protein n=1 Tax=Salmonella enterica TaxID=28901 RepID=UPI0009AD3BE2|nr:fimbrial protein [Salmonella enterica]EBO4428096.1 fimbrial protein [Salmonella enterica subsp. enterica]ECV3497085.1 fimbrial protein [Salmonella enterica subsp. enterica serovar Derby]EAA8170050.1 fimbrial protein [Salmonella enterica]EAN8628604.1 fimbrial protein [Salmonella enterica subsp. enterica serovar Adelaide]EAN8693035.1 fimbrial protein [Salmonella enterica]